MRPTTALLLALALAAPAAAQDSGGPQAPQAGAASPGGQSAQDPSPAQADAPPAQAAPAGAAPQGKTLVEPGKEEAKGAQKDGAADLEKKLLEPDQAKQAPDGIGPAKAEDAGQPASKTLAPKTAGKGRVPGAPDAVVVYKQAPVNAARIGTTASGRRALRDMSRFRGALDQGYKGSEAALPSGGAGARADEGSYSLDAMRTAGVHSGPGPGGAPPREELDDVALAALSGRRAAVDALGLNVRAGAGGRAVVTRRDGTPASPAEVAALRRAVAAEPRALDRRPDYFSVLPPAHYDALKADFNAAARPGAAPEPRFQDVGLQGQRDFEWTRSCSEVSGSCNPLSVEGHYDRGGDVSPETLESIYRAAGPAGEEAKAKTADDGADAEADEDGGQDLGDFDADDEKLAESARAAEGVSEHRLSLGGIGARLKALFGGLDFGRAARPAQESVAAAAAPGWGAVPPPAQTPASRAVRIGAASAGVAGPPAAAPLLSAKEAAPRRASRGAGLLALGAAGLLAAAWALRRR